MKKLYICGLQGQGKGLLAQLLDGHTEVFCPGFICCPGYALLEHDFVHRLLPHAVELREGQQDILAQNCTQGDVTIKVNENVFTVSVGTIWRQLFKKNFFSILIDSSFADWSNLYVEKAKDNSQNGVFNFVEFLNDSIHDIVRKKHFESVEQLQDTIYMSCIKNYKSPGQAYNDESYFLQQAFQTIENISTNNVDKKILVMSRDPISSSFMNTQRLAERNSEILHIQNTFKERLFGTRFEKILYSKKYIQKYKTFHKNLDILARNDESIYIVDFNEMVLDTNKCMNKIAVFLGIKPQPIMFEVTLNGMPISEQNGNYAGNYDVGKITHDPYKRLSNEQIQMLNYLYHGWDSKLPIWRNAYLAFNSIKLNLAQSRGLTKLAVVMRSAN